MRSWLSRLLPRRVLPGTGPVTTTLGTRSGDNNLWESMTSTAGKPPRAPRPPHIPGDIYQWASHCSAGGRSCRGLLASWRRALTIAGGWFMLCVVQEAVASETVERLSQIWRDFAVSECGTYSPLYAAICHSVADDPELLALAAVAPTTGQQPNVLLAAVHYLVLSGIAHPLADVYAGRADRALAPALFRDLCLSQRHDVGRILATRHTQTNEPGRAALLAIGL